VYCLLYLFVVARCLNISPLELDASEVDVTERVENLSYELVGGEAIVVVHLHRQRPRPDLVVRHLHTTCEQTARNPHSHQRLKVNSTVKLSRVGVAAVKWPFPFPFPSPSSPFPFPFPSPSPFTSHFLYFPFPLFLPLSLLLFLPFSSSVFPSSSPFSPFLFTELNQRLQNWKLGHEV